MMGLMHKEGTNGLIMTMGSFVFSLKGVSDIKNTYVEKGKKKIMILDNKKDYIKLDKIMNKAVDDYTETYRFCVYVNELDESKKDEVTIKLKRIDGRHCFTTLFEQTVKMEKDGTKKIGEYLKDFGKKYTSYHFGVCQRLITADNWHKTYAYSKGKETLVRNTPPIEE